MEFPDYACIIVFLGMAYILPNPLHDCARWLRAHLPSPPPWW